MHAEKSILHCLSLTIVSYSLVHPCIGYISCIFYEKPRLHYTTFANNSGITATRVNIVDQQVLGSSIETNRFCVVVDQQVLGSSRPTGLGSSSHMGTREKGRCK